MTSKLESKEIEDYLVKMRRYFHANPELSFQEVNTSGVIERELRELGLEPRRVGRTGIVVDVEGKEGGKTVAIRADIDALPVREETDLDFRSRNEGVMHACGHDSHIAMALGAAKILVEKRNEFKGTVRFLFQPAEESPPGGAVEMIRYGALEKVDYIIGQHARSNHPTGKVAIYYGPMMANADEFIAKIFGKGGHGSAPHETVDVLEIACEYVVQAQTIVSRRISTFRPAVVTFGTMNSGYRYNIIAPFAEMTGTVRTYDSETQEKIKTELEKMLSSLCNSRGAKYEFQYLKGYPALVNRESVAKVIEGVAEEVLGKEGILHPDPAMGGEDFAYYVQKVPGAFYFLGVGNEKKGITSPQHSPTYSIDEEAMKFGTEILFKSALRLLRL